MLLYPTLDNKTKMHSDYLQEDIYNLLDETFSFPNETYSFNIIEVTEEYVARPDLVALDAYGDTMFADLICKVNGISNPFELNEGMMLVMPAREDILNFINLPDEEESLRDAYGGSSSQNKMGEIMPKPKRKNEKRKPNEAIIGDTRFKIDKGSKIIIY